MLDSGLLKELVLGLALPFPLGLLLIGLGLIPLWFQRRVRGRLLVTVGWILLFLFSLAPTGLFLGGFLEGRFGEQPGDEVSNPELASVSYIVVLAGGSSSNSSLPVTSRHYYAQLARLVEGLRIHLKRPTTKVIVSGSSPRRFSDANIMKETLLDLGVRPDAIIEEASSVNTYEQALFIKKIVGDDPFFLVTSAVHMPRSIALFKKAGLKPIPHPANFRSKGPLQRGWALLRPRSENLWNSETALYEYYGLIQARLLGRL